MSVKYIGYVKGKSESEFVLPDSNHNQLRLALKKCREERKEVVELITVVGGVYVAK